MNVMVFGKSTILWILKSLISSFIDHGVLKFGNWLPHEIHQKLKGPRIIRFMEPLMSLLYQMDQEVHTENF
jgi:hypothetical protein